LRVRSADTRSDRHARADQRRRHQSAHARSDDAIFDGLERVLSPRELVELHLVVGLYATIAGVVTDFDVDLDAQSGAFDLDHDERGPRLGR
jgi:hypothetical protein